tara:strand:+ start:1424 stop:1798 length:375 start_codon:yes stop_codon:yes gene_type:complete
MPSRRPALKQILPVIAVSLAAICAPLLAAFEPVREAEAAAIFPPGWSHADVLLATAEADLAFVRFGAWSNIGIIEISDTHSAEALRRAGALLLLPPGALGGCLLPRNSPLQASVRPLPGSGSPT